jgi:hypothetical protein
MPQKSKLDLQPLDLQPAEELDLQPIESQPSQEIPPIVNQGAGQIARDLVTGGVKGMGNTISGVSQILNRMIIPSGETLAPQQGITALQQMSQPQGMAQKLGYFGEQAGEYLLPGGLEEKAGIAAGKALPQLGLWGPRLARTAAQALSTGTISGLQGTGAGTGAAMGAGTGALGEAGRAIAPQVAESALRISDRMRGRGKTIGQSVLDELNAVTIPSVARQAEAKSLGLTKTMEANAHAASQMGIFGSTAPAHQALDAAISKVPRNTPEIAAKLETLRDRLYLENAGAPMGFTPDDLLEMKRGINKTISTWPSEWQKLDDVKRAKQKLYGAIDSELDRIVPGNAALNQRISSLIPAKQQAIRIAEGEKIPQRMLMRFAARTGALLSGVAAGREGYKEGGLPGAVLGGTAGVLIPELITEPAAQMALARALKSGAITRGGKAVVLSAFGGRKQENK